jgi:hypothetical protein
VRPLRLFSGPVADLVVEARPGAFRGRGFVHHELLVWAATLAAAVTPVTL